MKTIKKMVALFLVMTLNAVFAFNVIAESLGAKEKNLISGLPNKSFTLHSFSKIPVSEIALLTGENSFNKTQSRFGVWGTDLGSFAQLGNTFYMFCGDTFSNEQSQGWRSNVLFTIEDEDFSDGLTITGAITDKRGKAKELLGSLKVDGTEITVIPTNLFAANEKLYCIYMSVSKWGDPGKWDCRYSGLAVSEDEGKKWKKLKEVQWPGDSPFIQTANVQIEDEMYFWGIPSGRFGGVSLMKVHVGNLENIHEYEYFVGLDEKENPKWIKGNEGINQAVKIIEEPIGEISVIYNEYLGSFLITYLDEKRHEIVVREGIFPWGEYSKAHTLVRASEYPALYGAYMHPAFVEEKGKSVYFAMSQFFPVYNIYWMRMDFP